MQYLQTLGLASLLLISLGGGTPAFCDADDEVQPPTAPATGPAPVGQRAPLAGHLVVEDSPAKPIASQAQKAQAPKKVHQAPPVATMPAPAVHQAQIMQSAQPQMDRRISFHDRHNLSAEERMRLMQMYQMQAQAAAGRAPLTAHASKTADTLPPYVWSQNFAGGYIDTSGHIKEAVWGDKVASLGGKFWDGTPVPKGPVSLNSRGHIWWQPQLSPGWFVKRDTNNTNM